MFYSKKMGLEPGDQIVEFITPLGITKHFAMYAGWDENGVEWIIENQKFAGVRLVEAGQHFQSILRIDRIEKFEGNNAQRRQVVQNALAKLGKPYNLFNYNCEHFITESTTGMAQSNQVKNAFGLLLACLFVRAIID
jgi:uncharacterized protein YycO